MSLAVPLRRRSRKAEVPIPPTSEPSAGRPEPSGVQPAPRTRPPRAPRPVWSTAVTILGALGLVFVLQVSLIGALQHARDQSTAYAKFRSQLALATAPVGQTDVENRLLPLGAPVAILSIPRLGVSEVVGEGTTASVLQSGPGHRRDTVLPGQAGVSVLLGRQSSYGGPFGRLHELRPGDPITVTTGQGKHTYVVTRLRRAGDPLPAPLAAGQGSMVLVTAEGRAYLPSAVLRVDAKLTSTAQPAPVRMFGLAQLGPAEQVMAGDPSAWILIVLWGQALLVAAVLAVWLSRRWGRWQAWIVSVPVLAVLTSAVAEQVSTLLPNLL